MAQAGLNNEKNWRSKISLDCPFKTLETRHRGRKNQFDGFFYIKASCVEDTEELVIPIGYAVLISALLPLLFEEKRRFFDGVFSFTTCIAPFLIRFLSSVTIIVIVLFLGFFVPAAASEDPKDTGIGHPG